VAVAAPPQDQTHHQARSVWQLRGEAEALVGQSLEAEAARLSPKVGASEAQARLAGQVPEARLAGRVPEARLAGQVLAEEQRLSPKAGAPAERARLWELPP
jgi:hypothetical protein